MLSLAFCVTFSLGKRPLGVFPPPAEMQTIQFIYIYVCIDTKQGINGICMMQSRTWIIQTHKMYYLHNCRVVEHSRGDCVKWLSVNFWVHWLCLCICFNIVYFSSACFAFLCEKYTHRLGFVSYYETVVCSLSLALSLVPLIHFRVNVYMCVVCVCANVCLLFVAWWWCV